MRPPAHELDSVTTYCTSTRLPAIPAGLRCTYRDIDSDSTIVDTTEKDRKNGSKATIEIDEKVDRTLNFRSNMTIGDKSLASHYCAVNIDELEDDEESSTSSASVVMLGKGGVTAAMYLPSTKPATNLEFEI